MQGMLCDMRNNITGQYHRVFVSFNLVWVKIRQGPEKQLMAFFRRYIYVCTYIYVCMYRKNCLQHQTKRVCRPTGGLYFP